MKNCPNPVIIGAAQYTQPKTLNSPLDPLNLMAKTSKLAITDTGTDKIEKYIDAIYMINIQSWSYEDAPAELAEILGLNPSKKIYLSDGGNTPQMLVNRAVRAISSGEHKAIMITGAEAAYSAYRAKKGKINLDWPERKEPLYMEGKIWHGTNEFENNYELIIPSYTYAIFETALRAKSNISIKEHNQYIGKLFKHFSDIASKNPYAWIQRQYSVDDIITPSLQNRNICHPYTKRMCSNVFVDQAGTIIITNELIAEELDIKKEKFVYHIGGSDLENIFNITQRPSLTDSPASREGVKLALEQAKLKLKDIDKFDIYSCFPSIVEIIMEEIGLKDDYTRDLTVTGGLPYFGGPWSNYSLHAIIRSVELIRDNPTLKIMVIANGGYNTKQSFGIYGKEASFKPKNKKKEEKIQKQILKHILNSPVKKANGELTIEGYTFIFNRENLPIKGIVIGILSNEIRTLAYIHGASEKLNQLVDYELVGKTFRVQFDKKSRRNIIRL